MTESEDPAAPADRTDPVAAQPVVVRQVGITPSERYLGELCDRTFLSLWSYPGPHRDTGGGKEICDLLVVFGDDVVIFSDKECRMRLDQPIDIAWRRWFRDAVGDSAKQAWGAERWLRQFPARVFLDRACTQPPPVPLPHPDKARYHLVIVARGIAAASCEALGGSGSLMLNSDLAGVAAHQIPFTVGDVDPSRSFVHVLDDTTLDIVVGTLDTVADFVFYLRAKEAAFRARRPTIVAGGEEELLARYLTNMDAAGRFHSFALPDDVDLVGIPEGEWQRFAVPRHLRLSRGSYRARGGSGSLAPR